MEDEEQEEKEEATDMKTEGPPLTEEDIKNFNALMAVGDSGGNHIAQFAKLYMLWGGLAKGGTE
jgi:hypothetical protein